MNTIFEPHITEQFILRIDHLTEASTAAWGKMNAKQMLKHCIENERLLLREKPFKSVFIGRIFGKMALNADTKDDKPFGKNSPTHPDLKFSEKTVTEDFGALTEEWISLLGKYPTLPKTYYDGFVHPFFRAMNRQQVGIWARKHVDHHLRQFGA
ncbi:MAG: hypothetical protein AAFW89_06500 [Bacteroidota bacterium]